MGRKGAALPSARAVAAATAPAEGGLVTLPAEVLLLVAKHLGGWELSLSVCVCREWRHVLTREGALWRAALEREFCDGEPATRVGVVAATQAWERAPRGRYKYGEPDDYESEREFDSSWEWSNGLRLGRGWGRREEPPQPSPEPGSRLARHPAARDWAKHRAAGGPPGLLAAEAKARRAAAEAGDGAGPRSWSLVRVVERPGTRWPDAETLRAWAQDLRLPYRLTWTAGPVAPGREATTQPRRVRVHAAPADAASATGDYHLYRQLAAGLLRGRCRVCACRTADRHPVLRVPMCADVRCAGTVPVLSAAQAAELLGAGALCAARQDGAPVGERSRAFRPARKARRARTKQPVMLVSTVARLAGARGRPAG